MPKLLIGTKQAVKIDEYKKLLKEFNFEILTLNDVQVKAPDLTGQTLEQNAVLKAEHYYKQTKIPTLADSSGFEISALGGEPGVKSKQWLGYDLSDEEAIAEVMRRMEAKTNSNRTAKLKIVMAVASQFGVITSEGVIEGTVGEAPSTVRVKGFPFRSVMFLPNYNKFYSELSLQEIDILDHRKAAFDKIKDFFNQLK